MKPWIATLVLTLLAAPITLAQPAPQFPDASESTDELIDLWEESNAICRGASGNDVKTWAACAARSVYGAALNEREWCFGREEEAGADMQWHQCEVHSLRFPRVDTWLF